MRVLSPILRQLVYPALSKAGYFSSRAVASVLTYHGVLPEGYRVADSFLDNTLITIESFRSQLRTLKRHYNVISPEQFRQWLRGSVDLPEHAVLLTCDDGLLNNLTTMAPVLREEGLQCLFFVTGSSLEDAPQMLWYIELYLMLMEGRASNSGVIWRGMQVPAIDTEPRKRRSQWLSLMNSLSAFDAKSRAEFLCEAVQWWGLAPDWKTRYLDDPVLRQRFQLLGTADLRQLADTGMTIGAHTLSHPELSRQADESARTEIIDCRPELERCTGRAVWSLAYPFGTPAAVGDRELQVAKEAGYECAFMNISGPLESTSKFALPRVHVTADMSLSVFEAHASGFHENLRRRLRPSVSSNGRSCQ
jgi:peptidoglycan/xylan/chitin deacetylase (PgdA/CDA1 family)